MPGGGRRESWAALHPRHAACPRHGGGCWRTHAPDRQPGGKASPEPLAARQVGGVAHLPPRQIGPFMSEVLTLGFPDEDGEVVLAAIERKVPNGGRLF